MLIRLRCWGLALLAAGSLCPASHGLAQDAYDTDALPATPPAQADRPLSIEERVLRRNRNRDKNPRIEDADYFKKHPPVWSLKDVTKENHPYASPSTPAPGGGHYPGGPTGQFGQPYYYSATSPDTSGTGGAGMGPGGGSIPMGGHGYGYGYAGGSPLNMGGFPSTGGYPATGGFGASPGYYGSGNAGFGYGGGLDYSGPGYAGSGYPGPGYGSPAFGGQSYAGQGYGGGYGGYGTGGGQYAAQSGQLPGNPYYTHFGPGFYRQQEAGHYRFPYYSYRAPWYFPGHPSYNRDTNIPW